MYSEPGSGIKLTANSCICWLFKRIDYDARNDKRKKKLSENSQIHSRSGKSNCQHAFKKLYGVRVVDISSESQ